MWRVMVAVRAAALVFGVTALAMLISRIIGDSGSSKGIAGVSAESINVLSFSISVFLLSYLAARSYWRDMFPEVLNWVGLALCLFGGLLFALFVNLPAQKLLMNAVEGRALFSGGFLVFPDFGSLAFRQNSLGWAVVVSLLLGPFADELLHRGVLFKESQPLGLVGAMLVSFLIYLLALYAGGGMAKALAAVPAAMVLVALRARSGSFVYSAALQIGINLIGLLKNF